MEKLWPKYETTFKLSFFVRVGLDRIELVRTELLSAWIFGPDHWEIFSSRPYDLVRTFRVGLDPLKKKYSHWSAFIAKLLEGFLWIMARSSKEAINTLLRQIWRQEKSSTNLQYHNLSLKSNSLVIVLWIAYSFESEKRSAYSEIRLV